jgi:hypothetical protein
MHPFEGFLESVSRSSETVVARFVVGDMDPLPQVPPVFLLTIEAPTDAEGLYQWLRRVQEEDSGAYVSVQSATQAHIETDHGNERTVVGRAVSAAQGQYEARDFARLAKHNYDWGQSQYKALGSHMNRLSQLRALLQEQHARVLVKLQGHAPGSTARTLYEQHLSFLSRALAELEA